MIETDVNARIRIEGAKRGVMLWRNNSGAFENEEGRWVRYGLANDSARISELIKSSDLIGVACGWWWGFPSVSGVFLAVECKRSGWTYAGTGREPAQLNYLNLVRKYGGAACFATTWEDVEDELWNYFANRCGTGRDEVAYQGKRAAAA